MVRRLFAHRSALHRALRGIGKVPRQTGGAALAAVFCIAALGLGGVCLIKVSGAFGKRARPQAGGGSTPGYTFTAIDVPAAGTGMLQGTMGTSINDQGDVTGVYLTAPSATVPNLAHGFVRAAATGVITTFDVPNAGTTKNQGTFPSGIDTAGDVAGMYFDANNAYHGFVRSAAGAVTEFDVPGAPTTIGHRGTLPMSTNAGGDVAGFFVDGSDVRHGFVRTASGTITAFDAPGAGTLPLQGTVPLAIDTAGDITGFYEDGTGTFHGFVRAANGTITAPIDAPAAGTGPGGKVSFRGTLPTSINASEEIAGVYADTNGAYHGFVYTAGSATPAFTTFDAPGAGATGLFPGTLPGSINAGGDVSGFYTDTTGVRHGFVRLAAGTFTAPIDAPSAATIGMFSGTILIHINTPGDITGTFEDTNGVFHAFVLAPSQAATATPVFSPPAGTYTSPQSVTISDGTAGATICYTTDGSTPTTNGSGTCTHGTTFSAAFSVGVTETIEAIATAAGFPDSAVATATYTIAAASPTFSPTPGTYTSAQMVTISDTTAGATICYTTDGSTPTTNGSGTCTHGTTFSAAFSVGVTETIEAIATAAGFSDSAVATANYTINLPTPNFQVSVNPTALTIVAGQSGTATFTVTPQNGFNSAVSFACSGLPSEASCSFNPASVTPNGAAVSSTLTVTTTAPSAAIWVPIVPSQRPLYAILCLVLAVMLGFAARQKGVLPGMRRLGVLILLLVALGLTSCGGGGGSSPANPGTPQGTTMVSVSASTSGSGATSHNATLTITITH